MHSRKLHTEPIPEPKAILDESEKPNESTQMLPMAEIAKKAGVPLSTAHKYVRRHPEMFHSTPSEKGKGSLFSTSDIPTLRELYENSPRRNQKPPERPKAKPKESVQEQLTPVITEKESTAPEIQKQEQAPPVAASPSIVEKTAESTTQNPSTESERTVAVQVTEIPYDFQRLEQTEQQILKTLENIDRRYRFMFDQFDHLNGVMSRSWEAQQAFSDTMRQAMEQFQRQDRIVDMLMEQNKKLEQENARYREMFSASEEVAAASEPESSTYTNEEPTAANQGGGFRWRKRRR